MPRPRFVPSAEQRSKVRSMAAFGLRQEDIARSLGLRSCKTLRRHFRQELDRAATEANARVAQCLYQQAISGKNTAATIFWMKTRGWPNHAAGAPRPVETPPLMIILEKEAA